VQRSSGSESSKTAGTSLRLFRPTQLVLQRKSYGDATVMNTGSLEYVAFITKLSDTFAITQIC
jgi:hypothetical protein